MFHNLVILLSVVIEWPHRTSVAKHLDNVTLYSCLSNVESLSSYKDFCSVIQGYWIDYLFVYRSLIGDNCCTIELQLKIY